ncbi:MAG TPA: hypothetical protein VHR47_12795, partial [Bacillota bacterium]|nr:hypothetical protein [Bacillota bacterium]
GYEEQSQNIVNKINESNKDKDYTLVFQTTPQGTISLVANGPTANGTYKFLLKSARQFIQEKNKVSNNLLQIYTDRLAKVEKELKQLDTQTKYRNTSKEITANLSDSLLRSSKLGYQQEAFNLKQNILMIRSFNARLLSEPNLGVVSGTHKPSIVVIAALLFGIIGGIVFVVIVDYVLEKVKGTKTQKA